MTHSPFSDATRAGKPSSHRGVAGARIRWPVGLVAVALLAPAVGVAGATVGGGQATADADARVSSAPEDSGTRSGSPALFLPFAASDTLEQLARKATEAAVLVDVRTPSGSRQGSGFLVDPGGRVLTNHHVIRNARGIRIKLASGDVYEHVTILAVDERRDIAILQIPGFELPFLELGNSDSLRIGSSVVLIGSPLGLENTVSTGIVSGRRQEAEGYQLLQITAPASQGSSGGAVLGGDGRVVGIAASQLEGGQNLNFAVPINYARGLLNHVDGEPVAVLRPTSSRSEGQGLPVSRAPEEMAVNSGLRFDLDEFGGFVLEMEARPGENRRRRIRIAYRLIETVSGGEPRIERYAETETTRRTEPFGAQQTIHTERRRTIVRLDGLRPVSSRGETAWWTGETWKKASHELEFDGYRVRGLITDSAGQAQELDRELPDGIILREVRDLAFATLFADSLIGRSVELVTFDPRTGEVATDRYDVEDAATVEVAGRSFDALRVNVASGLSNGTAYFRRERPRILLRGESGAVGETVEVVGMEIVERARPRSP